LSARVLTAEQLVVAMEEPVMLTAPRHASAEELGRGLPEVLASPADRGTLVTIVIRPATDQRRVVTSALLTPDGGVEGDRWVEEGEPDVRAQVSLMNARILRQIAGHEDAVPLAGDNLIVDLDLSEVNLPAGSRVAIGDEVVLELTDLPHTGCGKFQCRYGLDARGFVNNPRGKELNLRGRYASVVSAGTIRTGDPIRTLVRNPARP
jgi:MOSC domain-containing protein YiiM